MMIVDIGEHEFTILWNHVYFFALSDYPNISDWELHKLLQFVRYEKSHGRDTQIRCKHEGINQKIAAAFSSPTQYDSVCPPPRITECTACKQKGCLTEFVCHTASPESARAILSDRTLLSAAQARKTPGSILCKEKRNAANDPADYFDYIMFSWGNCQAGDRLILERRLGHDPSEAELCVDFVPGIRFYYQYNILAKRENAVFDGYHAVKLKDRLPLDQYLYAIVIPDRFRNELEPLAKGWLENKLYYIKFEREDLWEWSEKVYDSICTQNQ